MTIMFKKKQTNLVYCWHTNPMEARHNDSYSEIGNDHTFPEILPLP